MHQAHASTITTVGLPLICTLCQIERETRCDLLYKRRTARQEKACSLLKQMKTYLDQKQHQLPPKGGLAATIAAYPINRVKDFLR
ncbi:IS66 family transposase [Paremcibacter congregatus]|uniref:IS66 family transposase n=1 Tax=Paremcibacter congregatus TaxID=2043170 RepID=UPI003C6E3EF9